MSDTSSPLLSSEVDYKDSVSVGEYGHTSATAIDINAPLSLSTHRSDAEDDVKESATNDLRQPLSPSVNRPGAARSPSASQSLSSPSSSYRGSNMTARDNKTRFGIPYQVQIWLRSVLILCSLIVGAWAILYYVPDMWYLSWLPEFGFAGIAYLSFFQRNKLRLLSYLRLCSLLLVVSLHQAMCAVPVIFIIRLASHDAVGWRYCLLTPYLFGLMVFGRLDPVIHRHDPRSILVHILYDPPALLVAGTGVRLDVA